MALSIKTMLGTTAPATNTTTVSPATEIPDNCHTIIITNTDSTNTVLVAEGVADPTNPIPASDGTPILPTKTFNLTCGTKSVRANNSFALVYSTDAGSITVNITYVCTNIV